MIPIYSISSLKAADKAITLKRGEASGYENSKIDNSQPLGYLLEEKDFKAYFKNRDESSHKYSFGYAGVLGGSVEFSGAVKLANLSMCALRAGSGLSKIIAPDCVKEGILPYVTANTFYPLRSIDGHIKFDETDLDNATEKLTSLAFGMGLKNNEDTFLSLRHLLKKPLNLIIDADGLNALSFDPSILNGKKANTVITPHFGELSRILSEKIEIITPLVISKVKELALNNRITVLLKGAITLVTDGVEVYFINVGTAGMATAGSGDVLSGILSGLLAYNELNLLTVSLAAYINGVAGLIAESELCPISMTAYDTSLSVAKAVSLIYNRFNAE